MAEKLEIIIKATDQASKELRGISSSFKDLGLALPTAAAATAALSKYMHDAVKMGLENQRVMTELNTVLESTKSVSGLTAEGIAAMAAELQGVTRFGDETIIKSQAMLLTFTKIGKEIFPEATEAMLNMAEKFGSIEASAEQLGKALNEPVTGVTALRRVGVQLSDAQEDQIKKFVDLGDITAAQKVILGELETQVGGLARAMGKTTAGQMTIFNNRLGEIQESIGLGVLPTMDKLIEKISALAAPLMGSNKEFAELSKYMTEIAASPLFAMLDTAATTMGILNDLGTLANSVLSTLGINVAENNKEWSTWRTLLKPLGDAVKLFVSGPLGMVSLALTTIKDLLETIKSINIDQIMSDLAGIGDWGKGILGGISLPKFQSGGYVPGREGQPVPILAHGGELVLNREQQAAQETRIYIQTLNLNGIQNVSAFLAQLEALN